MTESKVDYGKVNNELRERFNKALKSLYLAVEELVEKNKDVGLRHAWYLDSGRTGFNLEMRRPEEVVEVMFDSFNWPDEYWAYVDAALKHQAELVDEYQAISKRHGRTSEQAMAAKARVNGFKLFMTCPVWEEARAEFADLERCGGDDKRRLDLRDWLLEA